MKRFIATALLLAVTVCMTGCDEALNKPQDYTWQEVQLLETDSPSESTTVLETSEPEPEITSTTSETESPPPETPVAETETPDVDSEETSAEPEQATTPTEEASASGGSSDITMPDDVESPYNMSYGDPEDSTNQLSNQKMGWYFNRNKEHQPPTAQREFDIRQFGGYYLGDISSKVVYLTFDHGYENGFTATILDVLKEKNVPAAFFVTQTYIRDNVELVMRSVEEGHLIGNHSVTHPSFPDLDDEKIAYEINETARYFQEITGKEMPRFFRPPAGEYSARTLALTQELGYKTIFWSFAHVDWLVDDQPGKEATYNMVMDNLHNGAIFLLHAVSQSNTEALPDIIDGIRAQGYEFKSLYELP